MIKYGLIIKDALILFVVSTTLVVSFNYLVKGIKKTADLDPVVTSIIQDDLAGMKEILETPKEGNLQEYQLQRFSRKDDEGRAPLHWATYVHLEDQEKRQQADETRVPIVQYLLGLGGDINIKDNEGWTGLMWASWSGLPKVVQALLEGGADINNVGSKGYTALMLASLKGHLEVVKILKEKGADTQLTSGESLTALEIAQRGIKQYPDKDSYKMIVEILK